jgi:hypothetical protein
VLLDVSASRIRADRTDITSDATTVVLEPVFTPDGGGTDRTRIVGTLWLNSGERPLRVGGHISFDDARGWRHLHVLTGIETDATTGRTTLHVEPPLRAQPTAGTAIHVVNPSGIFQLSSDDMGSMTQRPGRVEQLAAVDGVQAFPLGLAL